MKNFQNKVIYEEFGKQAPLEVLSNCMVGTEHFYKQYKEAANWYAKYNSEKTQEISIIEKQQMLNLIV